MAELLIKEESVRLLAKFSLGFLSMRQMTKLNTQALTTELSGK